jgi:hypothetical protein
MKKAASRGGLVKRPDSAHSDIRSALLSEVVSANTENISRNQRIRCVAEDTAARFVRVNAMINAAMQKNEKLFAQAFSFPHCRKASAAHNDGCQKLR